MNDKQLIITVKELRNIAGEAVAHLSDDELVKSIVNLDFLAGLYVKWGFPRKEVADKVEDEM